MKGIFKRKQKAAGLDARVERLICIGLIVSGKVCRELETIAKPEMFCSEFTRWTATEALEFWRRHGESAGPHIEDIFRARRRAGMASDLARLIEDFLSGISAEHEATNFNEGYVVDQAVRYFRLRSLKMASQDVSVLLDGGRVEEAETRWAQYRKVDRPVDEGINPFTDAGTLRDGFARIGNPLFALPGAAGKLLAVQLHRKNFVSFRGVVGRGKTYTLQELAKCAARARLNVAFVGVGDMSEEEYALRWAENLAGRSSDPEDCEPMWIPCLDCWLNQTDKCKKSKRACRVGLPDELVKSEFPHPDDGPKEYVPCSACSEEQGFRGASWWRWRDAVKPLGLGEAMELGKRFVKRMKGRDFRLVCYGNKEVTPSGLRALLERWRDYEDFIVDVLVTDYMDEVGYDTSYEQLRHNEGVKWGACRAIARDWNLLHITADQGDTGSYTTETIGLGNFNEDRRRNDALTGGIGINQTPSEKARGVARWAYFKLRRGHYDLSDQVCVVQALGQGRPVVGSWWRKRDW